MKKTIALLALTTITMQQSHAQTPWVTTGNSAGASDFLGTTNLMPLVFKTNNSNSGVIDPSLFNTALGFTALSGNTGSYNCAFGAYALTSNASGTGNTAIGANALYNNWNGSNNTALGMSTLLSNSTGSNNTASGSGALQNNTTGNYNTATGLSALSQNNTGSSNTAVGADALDLNNGSNNCAVGGFALEHNSTGNNNTSSGYFALGENTTGSNNTASGYEALLSNTTGAGNTAAGYQALYSNNGSDNTATGYNALYSNTTGTNNIATGYNALNANTTGTGNTATGYTALSSNTTGIDNIATGAYALNANTTGGGNTATGYSALNGNTTGAGNVAYGNNALFTTTTGNDNTGIGFASYPNVIGAGTLTNWSAIGFASGGTYSVSNSVELGNTSVAHIRGEVPFTTFSDSRIKDNVKANVPGLDFINRLRPVTYNLNIHKQNAIVYKDKPEAQADWDGKYDIEKITQTGFIAQEVEKAANDASYDFSGVEKPATQDGLYGVRYSDFIMPIVKSVQELSSANDDLKKQNQDLQSQVSDLKAMVMEMQQSMSQCCAKYQATNVASVTATDNALQPSLSQNVPNPFTSTTVIRCNVPGAFSNAVVKVYTVTGSEILSFPVQQAGASEFTIQSGSLAAGMYQYSLSVDGKMIDTKKMVLTK